MYEVWEIKDLPITGYLADEVTRLANDLEIDEFEALDRIIEEWHKMTFERKASQDDSENPLDAIEAKLGRIDSLCDQITRKLDLSSL